MGKDCNCVIVGWKNENGKRVPIYKKKDGAKKKKGKEDEKE